nr:unnamed protein product [Callosobruchus chinensis]
MWMYAGCSISTYTSPPLPFHSPSNNCSCYQPRPYKPESLTKTQTIITLLWLRGFPEKMKCIIQHNVRTVCSQKFKRTDKTLLFI